MITNLNEKQAAAMGIVDDRELVYGKVLTGNGWEADAKRAIHRALVEEVDLQPLSEDGIGQILKGILEEVVHIES